MAVLRACAVAASAFLLAAATPLAEDGKPVEITTADGMKLAATWWDEPGPRSAGVVLLHDFGGSQADAAGVVRDFRVRGLDVLSVDLRGHGDSRMQRGVDLGLSVVAGDRSLVSEMHADALAAVRWLARSGSTDGGRVALAGVGTGAAVALDAASRRPQEIAAVAAMDPAAKALAPGWAAAALRDLPVLLVSRARDGVDAETAALHASIPGSRLVHAPPPKLARADAPPRSVATPPLPTAASFVAARTGSRIDDVVLDGVVEPAGPHADPWSRATSCGGDAGGRAWAYRVGGRIVFGGSVPAATRALWIETRRPHEPDLPLAVRTVDEPGERAAVEVPEASVPLTQRTMPIARARRDPALARPGEARPAIRFVGQGLAWTFEGEWEPAILDSDVEKETAVRFGIRWGPAAAALRPADLDALLEELRRHPERASALLANLGIGEEFRGPVIQSR